MKKMLNHKIYLLYYIMVSVKIEKATAKGKKYKAIFFDDKGKRIKTTSFGSAGSSDYTIHGDKERKQRYLDRHKSRENWNDYMSAGSLSRFILWNKPTLEGSIKDYRKRFGLKKG